MFVSNKGLGQSYEISDLKLRITCSLYRCLFCVFCLFLFFFKNRPFLLLLYRISKIKSKKKFLYSVIWNYCSLRPPEKKEHIILNLYLAHCIFNK